MVDMKNEDTFGKFYVKDEISQPKMAAASSLQQNNLNKIDHVRKYHIMKKMWGSSLKMSLKRVFLSLKMSGTYLKTVLVCQDTNWCFMLI